MDPRAVVALLANRDTRAVLAGIAALEPGPGGAARERALARLLQAGLVEPDGSGGHVVAEAALKAALRGPAGAARGVERFLSREGRIVDYPARAGDRRALLRFLVERALRPGEELDERGLADRFAAVTDDPATLRRYLVDEGLLLRRPDGRGYRLPSSPPPGC